MNALILMTRVPIPGQTKTRLMDIMSGEDCAKLHTCFLKDLMNTLNKRNNDFDLFITYTPDESFSILSPLIPPRTQSFPQKGNHLGERMSQAIKDVFAKGYEKVILIGSDIPDITLDDIEQAFSLLDDNDVVLGPTYDGGYYLIGMNEPNDGIFQISKEWGGKSVLESTMDKGNRQGLTIGLAAKYLDIDTKEDLYAFYETYKDMEPPPCYHTMAFIKEWKHGKREIGIANP